uniref:Uncharacterized protein n=1 Tax=Myotis myotis TaxID=51298 RepID=A0A7J7UPE2_MYOMY|nr:hypothetical protein mMyoMyo1_008558 [Myotis myotis]
MGGDSGWLIPDDGAPSSLSLVTVLRSQEELPRPDSAFPPHVSRVCPVPPLASAASVRTDCGRRRGCGWGGRPWKSRLPRFGFQFLSQAPAHVAHSAPGGEKPPHFRSASGVPALEQSLGH